MSWKINFSARAQNHVRSIYTYIAGNLQSPENALGQVERIYQQIGQLDNLPNRYPVYEKEPWKSKGVRKLVVDKFLVFYLPDEEKMEVSILAVVYGGRKIEEIL